MELQSQDLFNTVGVTSQPLSQVDKIQTWLINYLSKLLEIEPSKISLTTSFDRYGLDSSATIGLTSDLGDWLGRDIDPGITYDYPTIESLAQHLA
jgi:acyl carrier protein